MFGPLGVPELIFILVLALLLFGPKKLPQIGRTLGRGMAEFKKASTELRRTLNTEILDEEIRQNNPARIVRDELDPKKLLSPLDDDEKKADEASKVEASKVEASKEVDPPKVDPPKVDPPKVDPPEKTVPRSRPPKVTPDDATDDAT